MHTESIVPKGLRHHSVQRRLGNAGGRCGWVGKKCSTDGALSPWRSCGLMDKALVFGTKDCRLESCQDQKTCATLAAGNTPMFALCPWWSCGLMDKALVFGTKDCRLESCQDQKYATLAA